MNKNNLPAYEIYYKMLELGSKHFKDGITYPEIKNNLIKDRCVLNDENEQYLLDWFDESFYHRESDCQCPRKNDCGCDGDDPCDNFDHVSKCKHHIHSESCINFLSFKESNNNLKIARTSLTISKFAIGIALLGVFLPMFYDKCYVSSELKTLREIKAIGNSQKNIIQDALISNLKQTNENSANPYNEVLYNQSKGGNPQPLSDKYQQTTKKVE